MAQRAKPMGKKLPPDADPTKYRRCRNKKCDKYKYYFTYKNFATHNKSHLDYKKPSPKGPRQRCSICNVEVANLSKHVKTEKHRNALEARQGEEDEGDPDELAVQDTEKDVPTLQEEQFDATMVAHARSIDLLERYNAMEKPSTWSEEYLANFEKNKRRRKANSLILAERGMSRGSAETPKFLPIAKRARSVFPLSAAEYMETKSDVVAMRRAYVVCTPAEARNILEDAWPLVSLVVRPDKEFRVDYIHTVEGMLSYLSTKPLVDMHRWDTPVNEPDYNQPKSMSGQEARRLFLETEIVVNFLNLANIKDNPVPWAIEGIRAYKILKEITEDNKAGKAMQSNYMDLASCVSFHILAKAGAFSMPHVDQHGVITTVTCDDGEKLWYTYETMTLDELDSWQRGDEEEPPDCAFPIYLRAGDVLIQPGGRVHAPYSITDVAMSGTMHWDSRQLVDILQRCLQALALPDLSNEGVAFQFGEKLEQIHRLWQQQHPAYPWGNDVAFKQWCLLFQKWRKAWEGSAG